MPTDNQKKPPPYVSYSALTTLLKCGEQYRLEKIERVPQKPAWYFAGGRAVHTATELWDTGNAEGRNAAELFSQVFVDEVTAEIAKSGVPSDQWRAGGRRSKEYPDKQNGTWWADHGPGMVQNYIAWRENTPGLQIIDLNGAAAIELDVHGELYSLEVKAFLDRVFALPTGELLVVDIKTGSRTPESKLQLGWYAELLEQRFGIRPSLGSYWMARTGVCTEPYDLTRYTHDVLTDKVRKFDLIRTAGAYIANVDSHCLSCGVSNACADFGGADAHLYKETT